MVIKTVGVVGCGVMGSGIAQVCAEKNYQVVVSETSKELLSKGISLIHDSFVRSVDKGKISKDDKDTIMRRIQSTLNLDDFSECDIVIEAAVENPELKKEIFLDLDRICPSHAILCSNTSCIPIMKMASATTRLDKVVGTHFFNPAHVMKLLELIRTIATSDETVATVTKFGQSLGKTVVQVKDMPGFVVTRLLVSQQLEAVRLLQEGVATVEDIDEAQRLGANLPMGPFQVIDLIGLDTVLNVANTMYQETKSPIWAAPPLLTQMVEAGYLGRKVKQGFYNY
ncbi:MAG: 3-hydroxybutyryl-CoA dehydrogenase [Chloroflexi bacterium]|nr:3-hydroxybutyryl-CoA dehydrogenase [Chloroflexota bacterium]